MGGDGRWYKGQWKDSVIHGMGRYLWPNWPDGHEYSGQYVLDRKEGFGIFLWPDGRKYEGFWLRGKQHGFGRCTLKDGSHKFMKWKDGKVSRDDSENDTVDRRRLAALPRGR